MTTRRERTRILRPTTPADADLSPAVVERVRAEQGGGTPLEPSMRESMEAAFGHRFGDVRVHADSESDALNRSLGASAFTLGSDIFLSRHAPPPQTAEGGQLLAHELTHVVQQGNVTGSIEQPPTISTPGDAHEVEATRVASSFRGEGVPSRTAQSVMPGVAPQAVIQRETAPSETKIGPSPPAPARKKESGRQYPGNPGVIAIETKYGPIWMSTFGMDVDAVFVEVAGSLVANREAGAMYDDLQQRLGALGLARTHVEQMTLPTGNPKDVFARDRSDWGRHVDTMTDREATKDISSSATPAARQQAALAEPHKNKLLLMTNILKDFRAQLGFAQKDIGFSLRALDVAEKRTKAAELRARGEQQEKYIQTALTLVGAAIEATAGILTGGAAPGQLGGPLDVAKPAYDAIVALVQLFRENDLIAKAEALERDAREIELQDAADRLGMAKDKLKHVKDMLESNETLTRDFAADYERERGRAEEAFDRSSRGAFRFGDVVQTMAMADDVVRFAGATTQSAERAHAAAWNISRALFSQRLMPQWKPPDWEKYGEPGKFRPLGSVAPGNEAWDRETEKTLMAIHQDAETWHWGAVVARERAGALGVMLRTLRMSAHDALVNAPGTGTPR